MNRKILNIMFAFLVLSTSMAIVRPAQAETSTSAPGFLRREQNEMMKENREKMKSDIEERKEQMMQKRQEKLSTFCEQRKSRLGNLVNFGKERLTIKSEYYNRLKTSVSNVTSKAKSNGISTTALEGYMSELETLSNTLASDAKAFKAKVDEASALKCDETNKEAFKSYRTEINALGKKVLEDDLKIRALVRGKIFPEIQKILSSLKTKPATERSN